jgi:hypothetical protein
MSLAKQGKKQTGTVTFSSSDVKHKAKRSRVAQQWSTLDDRFGGLTVLYAPAEIGVE